MSLPPAAAPVQARPAFNWIDSVVVPITGSIMETQPIAVGLVVLPFVFSPGDSGPVTVSPINSLLITALLLGLHWWAIFVNFRVKSAQQSMPAYMLNLLGFGVALLFALSIALLSGADPLLLVFAVLLTIWGWWRGILWTRHETNDEQLILTFKVGFIALILFLLFSMLRIYNAQSDQLLQAEAQALPIFFLSGLISLSFTRLSMMRQENARSGSVSRLDSSRVWLTVLSVLWLALVALSVSLELFSFQFIQRVFRPVLNALFFMVAWIIYIIDLILQFLLSPLNQLLKRQAQPPTIPQPTPGQSQPQLPSHAPDSISPLLLFIGRVALLIAVLLILALIAWAILRVRRHRTREDDNEREVREGLAVSTLFKGRQRQASGKAPSLALEPLDPQSARMHYRDLLQTVAAHKGNLSREPGETPAEYQRRLQVALPPSTTDTEDAPTEAAILDELTGAYIRERYGARKLDTAGQGYLRTWMPRLLQRLSGNPK